MKNNEREKEREGRIRIKEESGKLREKVRRRRTKKRK